MYCFEACSVGTNYASTSHEQDDSEWEEMREEGDNAKKIR